MLQKFDEEVFSQFEIMNSPFYRLRQTNVWGDYGTVLMQGLSMVRDELNGHLVLERAGPFAPPVMFSVESCVGYIVLVTDTFRQRLTAAGFGELEFKPTIKKRIVSIPWHTWDKQAKLPPIIPESGEPDDYLLNQPHSEEAAMEMEQIWEFIAPALPCEIKKREPVRPFCWRWHLTRPTGQHHGLFRPPGHGHVLFVDQVGREWFEREAGGWVDFDDVTVLGR